MVEFVFIKNKKNKNKYILFNLAAFLFNTGSNHIIIF